MRLYKRSRTVSHDLSRSCTIANTIIHGHVELTRDVNLMCGCIYGLVCSHTVSHGLVRLLIRLYTDMAPVSVFKLYTHGGFITDAMHH